MTLAAGEVRVAGNGEISVAPTGSTAPTNATTALDEAFIGMGYNSDTGLTVSRSVSTTNVAAWQTLVPVRLTPSDQGFTIAGEFLQSNPQTAGLWMQVGDFTQVTPTTDFKATADINPAIIVRAVVLEWEDGDLVYRIYIPKAQVTPNGDETLSRAGAALYPLMFTALAPDTGTDLFEFYTNDPAFDPGS